MTAQSNKTIYIIFMPGYDNVKCLYHIPDGQPKDFSHFIREEVEKTGCELKFTSDAYDLKDVAGIISWDLNQNIINNIVNYPRSKCCLLTFEPPLLAPHYYNPELKRFFGTIYISTDDLVDNQTFFKLQTMSRSYLKVLKDIPDYSQKKFCAVINSNKKSSQPGELYNERRKAISFFTKTGDLDLFGMGWQGFESWRGEIGSDKWEILKNYKFTICYENSAPRGYVTERLLDAFACGCVPVYLGPTNTNDYVPKECFIDLRNFRSYPDLYQYMKNMDQNTYESYRTAARKFLESPLVQQFSPDYTAKRIVERVLRG
jgi:alpha(1,3/1,4) fucosyltransferase